MKTSLLALTPLLLLPQLLLGAPNTSQSPIPNLVIINIDDLGYADIEPFGSTLNRTPNLNRMAADRKSTRLNSSHLKLSRMPSSA